MSVSFCFFLSVDTDSRLVIVYVGPYPKPTEVNGSLPKDMSILQSQGAIAARVDIHI